MATSDERAAERAEAEQHLEELRATARRLWYARDDAHVLSELTNLAGAIRQAEKALR
jgi:hypothetical protein